MIDCMVEGGQVIPVMARVTCDLVKLDASDQDRDWPDDGTAVLVFSEQEREEVIRACDKARLPYSVKEEPQPDPELLAKLHGRVTSRSAAVAALESGIVPGILADIPALDERLKEVEAKPIAARATPS